MSENPHVFRLDQAAQKLARSVSERGGGSRKAPVGWWLGACAEMFGADLEDFADGIDAAQLAQLLRNDPMPDQFAEPVEEITVLNGAEALATRRNADGIHAEDIARTVLALAGYRAHSSRVAPVGAALAQSAMSESRQVSGGVLDKFGRDLTADGCAERLIEPLGRDQEIKTLVEVLCRTTKRNPVLVGPAGVGKTAIAEGLALRIARGQVPTMLKGFRLVAIQPSVLAAGVSQQSELQERVKQLLEEAANGRVLLFIDEVHSLVGMAGDAGANDLAALFKPALARGEVAVIAATTDAEYRRFIEGDAALERRFQPIRVQELGREATLELLKARRTLIGNARGVRVGDDVLSWMVEFAERRMRSRYFPDKAIDLLEQCIASAAASGESVVTLASAEKVAERMVGMPDGIESRVTGLKQSLLERGLLSAEDTSTLVAQLHVRLRGLGVSPERPTAVILMFDVASCSAGLLAETIAESLYGSPERVVAIDFGRLSEAQSLPLLLGAPPSYVGYQDTAPIHALLQAPWSVLRIDNFEAAHALIRPVLEQAIVNGYFTDGSGRRVYLSDTVVIVSAGVKWTGAQPVVPTTTYPQADDAVVRGHAEALLGAQLVSLCDIVIEKLPADGSGSRAWVDTGMLDDLAQRLRHEGLDVQWDDSLKSWLAQQQAGGDRNAAARLLDDCVTPKLLEAIPPVGQRLAVRAEFGPQGVVITGTQEGERSV